MNIVEAIKSHTGDVFINHIPMWTLNDLYEFDPDIFRDMEWPSEYKSKSKTCKRNIHFQNGHFYSFKSTEYDSGWVSFSDVLFDWDEVDKSEFFDIVFSCKDIELNTTSLLALL